jgi:hypothetical protein
MLNQNKNLNQLNNNLGINFNFLYFFKKIKKYTLKIKKKQKK